MVAPTWTLDVVADDRHTGVGELLRPHGVRRDEDGRGVDEGDARVDGALRVELVSLFRTHREVGQTRRRTSASLRAATTSTPVPSDSVTISR